MIKVCSLAPYPPKHDATTSGIYLNTEINKLSDVHVDLYKWNFDSKFQLALAPFLKWRAVRNVLKTYDVVHFEYSFANFLTFLPVLWFLSIGRKARIVLTLHESYEHLYDGWSVQAIHNLWYRIADAIIVHTQKHKDLLGRNLASRTFVQPHGVIYRPELNRNPVPGTILLPGFITSWKGHDIAVSAIAKLVKRFPDVRLIIIGKPHDKEFTQKIHDDVEKLGTGNNVEFHEGYIPEGEFFSFFEKSEICLLPYKRITMSGILCHVLSWNVPCVMSDLEAFRLFTGGKGIFFKNEDVTDLAEKLALVLESENKRKELENEWRQLADKYSWQRIAVDTVELYKKVLRNELAGY